MTQIKKIISNETKKYPQSFFCVLKLEFSQHYMKQMNHCLIWSHHRAPKLIHVSIISSLIPHPGL